MPSTAFLWRPWLEEITHLSTSPQLHNPGNPWLSGRNRMALGCRKRQLLVGGIPTPLKNMTSSVGMIIPNWMESHKIHVPNHQPAFQWIGVWKSSKLDGHFGIWEMGPGSLGLYPGWKHVIFLLGFMDFPMKNGIYRLIGIDPWPQMELLKLWLATSKVDRCDGDWWCTGVRMK